MEEYAIVLDHLPHGRHEDGRPIYKKEPIALALGEKFLTLVELVPRKGVELKSHERVYIGKEQRKDIEYIKKRITYKELSSAAKSELPYVIEEVVNRNERRFLDFFNTAQAISTRLHSLELLPGIGKKIMWEILDERKKKPFESFEDLENRVKSLTDPKKLIARRIVSELDEEDTRLGKHKYKLFVPPGPTRRRG